MKMINYNNYEEYRSVLIVEFGYQKIFYVTQYLNVEVQNIFYIIYYVIIIKIIIFILFALYNFHLLVPF